MDLSLTSFSGNIPNSISNLKHLNVLRLHDSNFSGLIPSSLGNLSRLTNIHLSGNTFGGEIPSSFGRLHQLTSLDVNSNKLSGNFPIALLNLTKLSYLSLSYNQFTGILPPNISSLSSLENSFFGTIPSTLFFTIPSLGTIDLADNQLSGALGFVNMSSPLKVFLESHFTGSLPDIFKNATNLRSLNLGHNHFVGETSKIFDKLLFSGGPNTIDSTTLSHSGCSP